MRVLITLLCYVFFYNFYLVATAANFAATFSPKDLRKARRYGRIGDLRRLKSMLVTVLNSSGHAMNPASPGDDDMGMKVLAHAILGGVEGNQPEVMPFALNCYRYRTAKLLLFQQAIQQASYEDDVSLLRQLYEDPPFPFTDEEYDCIIRYAGESVGNCLIQTNELGSLYFENPKRFILQAYKMDNPYLAESLELAWNIKNELTTVILECFHKSQIYQLTAPITFLKISGKHLWDLSPQDYVDILRLDKSKLGEDGRRLDDKVLEMAMKRYRWSFYTFIKKRPKANDTFSSFLNPTRVFHGHATLNRNWGDLFSCVDEYIERKLSDGSFDIFLNKYPDIFEAFNTLLGKFDIDSSQYHTLIKKLTKTEIFAILKQIGAPEATKTCAISLLEVYNEKHIYSSARKSREMAKLGDFRMMQKYMEKAKNGQEKRSILMQSFIGANEGNQTEIAEHVVRYYREIYSDDAFLFRVVDVASIEKNVAILEYLHIHHPSLFKDASTVNKIVRHADESVASFLLSSGIAKEEHELLTMAAMADNVELVQDYLLFGDYNQLVQYCYVNQHYWDLASPKVFSFILGHFSYIREEDLIDILRLDKRWLSLFEKTKLENMIMWRGFKTFGWDFYTFAHRHQKFNTTNSGLFPPGQISLKPAQYVRDILNAFIEENLDQLISLTSSPSLEDVVLDSLRAFADEDPYLIFEYRKHLQSLSKEQLIGGLIKANDPKAKMDQIRFALGIPGELESFPKLTKKEGASEGPVEKSVKELADWTSYTASHIF